MIGYIVIWLLGVIFGIILAKKIYNFKQKGSVEGMEQAIEVINKSGFRVNLQQRSKD